MLIVVAAEWKLSQPSGREAPIPRPQRRLVG